MDDDIEVPRWTEDDGTQVWLVLGDGRGLYRELSQVEDHVRRLAEPGAVFGANASADDDERVTQLTESGYRRVLSMVDLYRDLTPIPARVVEAQIRPVVRGEHEVMHRLAETVWSGRSFFTMPSVDSYRQWVEAADPELVLLAFDGPDLIAYVVGTVETLDMRVDDLLVHPARQRRGIATELIRRLTEQASRRGCRRLILETEGDDPVGARTFYESLGFALEAERLRFRRPVTN